MRTRFAPSPTGFLHIGSMRNALLCYLIARQTGDNFLLRIEDTDQEREVEGSLLDIVTSLEWMHIAADEGVVLRDGAIVEVGEFGPYTQSKRLPIYKKYADELVAKGLAYYAFDTVEELETMRANEKQAGNPAPKYDASVRMKMKNSLTLTAEDVQTRLATQPYVIRLKVDPNRHIECQDIVRGKSMIKSYTIEDQILLKSDGFPTYHLACVVDDHTMQIDLVVRGEEWLPSLPKHVLLYEAFGWQQPQFAHVSLLLNPDGTKLSKRQGDVGVRDYIAKGYLPEALLNFLALLGWNPGTTQDIFTAEELITQFSFKGLQKAGAVFDTKKLDWLQGQWIRKFTPEEFAAFITPTVLPVYPQIVSDAQFIDKARLIQERLLFASEAPAMLQLFYEEPVVTMDVLLNEKQKVTADVLPAMLSLLVSTLEAETQWTMEHLKTVLFAVCEAQGIGKGQLLWPLRAALTGVLFSPGAFEVAALLGKDVTLARLRQVQALV